MKPLIHFHERKMPFCHLHVDRLLELHKTETQQVHVDVCFQNFRNPIQKVMVCVCDGWASNTV